MLKKLFLTLFIITSLTLSLDAGQTENMKNPNRDTTELNMKKFKEGVDFYAMGSEPFWNLDLSINQFIHFNELEGVTINLGSVKGEKAMDANVTRYMSETVNGIFYTDNVRSGML